MANSLFSIVRTAFGVSSSVDKKNLVTLIRKLQRSDTAAEIPSVHKILKKDLLEVCQELEKLSDEESCQHLAHLFYLYEGGKAVTKYVKFIHHLLNDTQISQEVEQNAIRTYILILEITCKLSKWCDEISVYQQTIESGLLDTLLAEIRRITARRDTRLNCLVLLLYILHLLYNTARIPWTRSLMKNRTLPVLLQLYSSNILSGEVSTLSSNIRFLSSVTAGCLLAPPARRDSDIIEAAITFEDTAHEIQVSSDVIDLVLDSWRVVGNRPVENSQEKYHFSGEKSPEEELLRVSADALCKVPDFVRWITTKDFVQLLVSDIMERGSFSEKGQCLRFLLGIMKWETVAFIVSVPRLSRILHTLVATSGDCLGGMADQLHDKFVSVVANGIDDACLAFHEKHMTCTNRDCRHCDILDTLSNSLRQLTSWGCTDIIEFMFGPFPQNLKRMLVNRVKNGESILLTAMKKSHKETLDLLLAYFGADVNQMVVYTHFPSLIKQEVPLLWWAAAEEKVDMMKALLRHGALVDDTASLGSTPLFSACSRQRAIAIKFLLQHGADPNKADHWGVTCLMKATVSPHLCQLLLDKGSLVNAQDARSRTALHFAISKKNQSVVELLIENGADYLGVCDHSGSNALQYAAIVRCTEIVDYIIDRFGSGIPAEEKVKVYRLLTAYLIDEDQNFVKARHYWDKAFALAKSYGVSPISYTERPETFPSMRRVCNISDLAMLNSRRIQPQEFAIFIKESILGPEHRETLLSIFNRGLFLLQIRNRDQCLAYWMYVLQMQHAKHSKQEEGDISKPLDCIGCTTSLVDVIFEACNTTRVGGVGSFLNFQLVKEILDIAVEDGLHVAQYIRMHPADKDSDTLIRKYLLGMIKLVYIAQVLQGTDAELMTLIHIVRKLVGLKICTSNEQGLLLLATDRASRERRGFSICDGTTISLFLDCGEGVNQSDNDGNSPLHNCVMSYLIARAGDVTKWMRNTRGIAKRLLEYGAHVDSRNAEGMRCEETLVEMDVGFHPVLYGSLGCLTARVIKQQKLVFRKVLPKSLWAFVESH